MEYARIENGVVAEIFTPPAGFPIEDCFHAEVVRHFVAVPAGLAVAQGWQFIDGVFQPPAAPAA